MRVLFFEGVTMKVKSVSFHAQEQYNPPYVTWFLQHKNMVPNLMHLINLLVKCHGGKEEAYAF
jgi:hypothetical protein